jgi:hypothetical protein
VPKPARDILAAPRPWWPWLVLALLVAAVIGLLVWWLWRRRRRRVEPAVNPYEVAEREFARIEALGLVEAGERGRYVALMVEVLRDYLAARYAKAPLSHTSTEVLVSLHGERAVPNERLTPVLTEADLIKFGRRPVTAARARELGREARTIVAQEHAAKLPAPAVAKAA